MDTQEKKRKIKRPFGTGGAGLQREDGAVLDHDRDAATGPGHFGRAAPDPAARLHAEPARRARQGRLVATAPGRQRRHARRRVPHQRHLPLSVRRHRQTAHPGPRRSYFDNVASHNIQSRSIDFVQHGVTFDVFSIKLGSTRSNSTK